MKKSLKKSRKPIGAIFRHTLNKLSPTGEKLILDTVDKIKKTVPEPLKQTAKEVSKEASHVQQRNPLDQYDAFKKKTPVSPLFSLDPKMRPFFQINNQMRYPYQIDQAASSKVLPTFRVDQSKAPSMFSFDQSTMSNISPSLKKIMTQPQPHPDGGSVVHKKKNLNKIGYFKSKTNLAKYKRFTIFNKSRRPYF